MATNNPLFIFPYSKGLEETELSLLKIELDSFLRTWNTHGTSLNSNYWIEENQFVLIKVDEELASPSGCSKDKLFHFFENFNKTNSISLGRPDRFYLGLESGIVRFSRKEIVEGLEKGTISSDDVLYPIWIASEGEFEKMWKKPISFFAPQLRLQPIELKF
jgi:hypothetical protein